MVGQDAILDAGGVQYAIPSLDAGQFVSPIIPGLVCVICLNVVVSPPVLKCSHLLCFQCFLKIDIDPVYGRQCPHKCSGHNYPVMFARTHKRVFQLNRFAVSLIESSTIQCRHRATGCQSEFVIGFEYRGLRQHEQECAFATVTCAPCGQTGLRNAMTKHAQLEICDGGCGVMVRACQKITHETDCSIAAHMRTCPFQCQEKNGAGVHFLEFDKHVKLECLNRAIRCETCDIDIQARDLQQHETMPYHRKIKTLLLAVEAAAATLSPSVTTHANANTSSSSGTVANVRASSSAMEVNLQSQTCDASTHDTESTRGLFGSNVSVSAIASYAGETHCASIENECQQRPAKRIRDA